MGFKLYQLMIDFSFRAETRFRLFVSDHGRKWRWRSGRSNKRSRRVFLDRSWQCVVSSS